MACYFENYFQNKIASFQRLFYGRILGTKFDHLNILKINIDPMLLNIILQFYRAIALNVL